jgi:ATP-dependent DNA helicase RecG
MADLEIFEIGLETGAHVHIAHSSLARGFEIAEVDLKLRGPGDLMGTQQSGVLNLQIADLVKDRNILYLARNYAVKILKEDTALEKPINSILREVFMEISKRKNIWNYIS